MKLSILSTAAVLLSIASAPLASAHCQVPCGIYADANVFVTMQKDQETIAKAMTQITELSKDSAANTNQLVRWVTNKEQHAQSIQDTVAQYFLAQRIKLSEAETSTETYAKKLALLHQITVYAMKCKQTTDPENAKKLHAAIEAFQTAYAGKKATASHSH